MYAHPEDIKGELRKRHGSIAAFERKQRLPPLSVRDVLRGKSRSQIAKALANELGIDVSELNIFKLSHIRDNTPNSVSAHRLNAGAK